MDCSVNLSRFGRLKFGFWLTPFPFSRFCFDLDMAVRLHSRIRTLHDQRAASWKGFKHSGNHANSWPAYFFDRLFGKTLTSR